MSDKFLNGFERATNGETVDDGNVAFTENGAMAFASTKSDVLDFFAAGGAMRERDESSVIQSFQKAFNEDPLLATKALFYFRDVRGGQGERKTFRTILKWLAETNPQVVRANLNEISEYGRWDDLFTLLDTPVEDDVWNAIDVQLAYDMSTKSPSLLAKWLKSENTSSSKSRAIARRTRRALGLSPRRYRKMLTSLRKKINLVEQHISRNDWKGIEYDKIPSKAGLVYRNAFIRHDEARYNEFLTAVKSGEKKMNVKDLYPYEIVEKAFSVGGYFANDSEIQALDAMWNNLPDYFNGTETRGIVVADTSNSMRGRPLAVAISLAMYTSERNKGPFHNKFITFSNTPSMVTIEGETIGEQVRNLAKANWDFNTNIEAVFDVILNTATKNKLSQDELPTHLYIVSDMEFDGATSGRGDVRLFQSINEKYRAAGYRMPFLVFWNVNSRHDQQPMSMDERGFQLVSGCSPSIFTSLLSNTAVSAYDLMLEVLNGERYAPISVE